MSSSLTIRRSYAKSVHQNTLSRSNQTYTMPRVVDLVETSITSWHVRLCSHQSVPSRWYQLFVLVPRHHHCDSCKTDTDMCVHFHARRASIAIPEDGASGMAAEQQHGLIDAWTHSTRHLLDRRNSLPPPSACSAAAMQLLAPHSRYLPALSTAPSHANQQNSIPARPVQLIKPCAAGSFARCPAVAALSRPNLGSSRCCLLEPTIWTPCPAQLASRTGSNPRCELR